MFPAARGEAVHATGGALIVDDPGGCDVAIFFELAERAVECTLFDLGVGKGVFPQLRRKIVSAGRSSLTEEQENDRLDEPINLAHAACAWMISPVPAAYSLWHCSPPWVALPEIHRWV